MYYLYLLECSDGSYYVGVTNDLSRRIVEHQKGVYPNCYTYFKRPVSLLHYCGFASIKEAIFYEHKIKKWSRAKKHAFFKKDWKNLHEQAKCRNKSSHELRSSEDET